MPAAADFVAKPSAAVGGTISQDKMSIGPGGDMKSKMNNMQGQMTIIKSIGNLDANVVMMMCIHQQGAITMVEA